MTIGNGTTSLQLHRHFSYLFKSWYFSIFSCFFYDLLHGQNGQAIFIIVQLLSFLSITTMAGLLCSILWSV